MATKRVLAARKRYLNRLKEAAKAVPWNRVIVAAGGVLYDGATGENLPNSAEALRRLPRLMEEYHDVEMSDGDACRMYARWCRDIEPLLIPGAATAQEQIVAELDVTTHNSRRGSAMKHFAADAAKVLRGRYGVE